MLSIQVRKNIDIIKEYGSGERGGEVEPWPNKEPEELEEQHMDTAIVSTLQLYMQTSWTSILCLKLVNCPFKEYFYNLKPSVSLMCSVFLSLQLLQSKKLRLH